MTNESNQIYKCRYCEKQFRKESTLAVHLCWQKSRWQQEKETGVQLGLKAYLRFYEITQGSARLKSYEDFSASPYYNAFVKFGRYSVDIRSVNFINHTEWLLKNNKKIDHWCRDSLYEEWLQGYIKKEAVQDALERGLTEMQKYTDETEDLTQFNYYFHHGNANRICHHISSGRISPWVVYHCKSGVDFLENLREDQIGMIMPWIDPDFWQKKFSDYLADAEWAKHVLGKAGL